MHHIEIVYMLNEIVCALLSLSKNIRGILSAPVFQKVGVCCDIFIYLTLWIDINWMMRNGWERHQIIRWIYILFCKANGFDFINCIISFGVCHIHHSFVGYFDILSLFHCYCWTIDKNFTYVFALA